MTVLAHIAGIPVQEWAPFVVPVIVLYLIGRRKGRLRRAEVKRLPAASELLDEGTVERVVSRWAATRHSAAAARHLPIFYPPGPEGMTAAQLAERTRCDSAGIDALLVELEDLGYLELDERADGEQTVSLTVEGYDLLDVTESVLLEQARERSALQAEPR